MHYKIMLKSLMSLSVSIDMSFLHRYYRWSPESEVVLIDFHDVYFMCPLDVDRMN